MVVAVMVVLVVVVVVVTVVVVVVVELSTYGRRSFSYASPSTCNALPDYLKNSTLSLSVFRNQLKHFLFSSY